ncbi:nicotinamide riboside transporter PnuC [Butyrivibrio sp. XPD2006]|uniref:nicotinamide riboside transporter PnuC n=1 Tax=Butyrivibrio sp. XPD2006 TaxID=1280668 RepID=UPI0003B5E912|nr:nicotinamide riboside transporter PnuC [Butyrivibrio sp. XPD2006]
MSGLKKFLKSEFTGWKPFDVIWLVLATAVILGLSLYWKDTWISLGAAVTGVICVILTGKGKRSSFIFGVVNTVLYAIVAMEARYYGEVMLNLIYYLPLNFVGFVAWKKHMNDESGEVIKERLNLKQSAVIYAITAIAIVIYGYILKRLGGNLPYIDSMSTVISVVAQILCLKRLMEQWVLWIVVDVVTVIMWAINFINGGESIATLAMWSIYLINAFIMFFHWYREARNYAV